MKQLISTKSLIAMKEACLKVARMVYRFNIQLKKLIETERFSRLQQPKSKYHR